MEGAASRLCSICATTCRRNSSEAAASAGERYGRPLTEGPIAVSVWPEQELQAPHTQPGDAVRPAGVRLHGSRHAQHSAASRAPAAAPSGASRSRRSRRSCASAFSSSRSSSSRVSPSSSASDPSPRASRRTSSSPPCRGGVVGAEERGWEGVCELPGLVLPVGAHVRLQPLHLQPQQCLGSGTRSTPLRCPESSILSKGQCPPHPTVPAPAGHSSSAPEAGLAHHRSALRSRPPTPHTLAAHRPPRPLTRAPPLPPPAPRPAPSTSCVVCCSASLNS